MNLKHTAAFLVLALAAVAQPAQADGSINATLGGRVIKNEKFLSPVERPVSLGVVSDFGFAEELPLFLSVSGVYSSDTHDDNLSTETSLDIFDLGVGLKLMPQAGQFRPYVGGGALRSWVQLETGNGRNTDSDATRGWYADAGMTVWIGRHFDIGANLRWVTDTHVQLYGVKGDLDSRIYSLVVGYTWGEPAARRHHQRRRRDSGD